MRDGWPGLARDKERATEDGTMKATILKVGHRTYKLRWLAMSKRDNGANGAGCDTCKRRNATLWRYAFVGDIPEQGPTTGPAYCSARCYFCRA